MVLPLTYFIEKPFQNWTRTGAALLGTVFLYVDYSAPVEPLREQLPKILETETLWDGAVQALQVTDAKESTVELRLLVSARNSKDLFDLRCNVRERMIAFLHEHHPTALPTRRQSPSPIRPCRRRGRRARLRGAAARGCYRRDRRRVCRQRPSSAECC